MNAMKKQLLHFSIGCLLLVLPGSLIGQGVTDFWKQTISSPSNNTEIKLLCIANNNTKEKLYVGTSNGIYESNDDGVSWNYLNTPSVPVLQLEVNGETICGVSNSNNLIISNDNGLTWKTTYIPNVNEITDVLIMNDGTLFVATGHIISVNGVGYYRGDGLFKSKDNGETWNNVNTGVPDGRYISKIIKDSKERIFIGYNEYGRLDGQILYSNNLGRCWFDLPPVQFDWGGYPATSDIAHISYMSFDANDILYLSFQGANGSAASSVILKNSYDGAINGSEWTHMNVVRGYTWFYQETYNLFITSNNDMYASMLGTSFNLSGPFYSPYHQEEFNRVGIQPIVFNDGSYFFNLCTFAQHKNGRVFMVQLLDNIIYYTEESMSEPLGIPGEDDTLSIHVFPNPTSNHVTIQFNDQLKDSNISIRTLTGDLLLTPDNYLENKAVFNNLNLEPGIYLVVLQAGEKIYQQKLIIN